MDKMLAAVPSKIISHRMPLKRIHETMEIMASPNHHKIIINPRYDPQGRLGLGFLRARVRSRRRKS